MAPLGPSSEGRPLLLIYVPPLLRRHESTLRLELGACIQFAVTASQSIQEARDWGNATKGATPRRSSPSYLVAPPREDGCIHLGNVNSKGWGVFASFRNSNLQLLDDQLGAFVKGASIATAQPHSVVSVHSVDAFEL